MSEIVQPSEYYAPLIVWSTFNIFAACSIALLLAVTLISQGRDANRLLINLEGIFILTSASGSLLIWTGHALDSHPPYGLCLFNASIGMANVPLMGGSALAIVLKVWGGVLLACRPRSQKIVRWIIWDPVLFGLPYVSGFPVFVAGLVIGVRDRTKVYRGSPFYCVVDNTTLQNAASGFGAAYTFSCLVLASWTTINLIITRWRVRQIIDYPGVSYSFICRTLVFSIFVSVAFVVGILSLMSTFSAIMPDVFLSSCAVAVFFIFSTSKPIIQFVFRCRRVEESIATRVASPKPWLPDISTTAMEVPRELLTFSLNGSGTTTSVGPAIWRIKAQPSIGEEGQDDGSSGHSKEATDALA
ncbi:hypothetical protein K438DRAFT_1830607 [Mycena galopus ATCC 62051]|nr:hypothetical protein K438DRAFT_1830607 [Mycena galopus ATCC 62051]